MKAEVWLAQFPPKLPLETLARHAVLWVTFRMVLLLLPIPSVYRTTFIPVGT
jgi:hypothetical protein